jgi:hypothetical protein
MYAQYQKSSPWFMIVQENFLVCEVRQSQARVCKQLKLVGHPRQAALCIAELLGT